MFRYRHLLVLLLVFPFSFAATNKDFDGDGYSDIAVRRAATGTQYILNSTGSNVGSEAADGIQRIVLGSEDTDIPIVGDFDGDGVWDIGVRRPQEFKWLIRLSSTNEIVEDIFGRNQSDIPVPADYDGDGISDLAVRRPSTFMWYIKNSSGVDLLTGNEDGISRVKFGTRSADIPVPADYDGDGRADIAVRRPSTYTWYIKNSSGSNFNSDREDGIQRVIFGKDINDIPVPADYDGDGLADIAVRRSKNFIWYIKNSSGSNYNSDKGDGIQRVKFGLDADDIPVVADYDGDGLADIAVRRSKTKTFFIKNSSDSNFNSTRDDGIQRVFFGKQEEDIAILAPQYLLSETITLADSKPVLSVSDQSHTIGLSNTIVGSCTDNEDGSLALSPGTYQPDSPGPHSVTVSCTDSEGASDSRVISITGVCSAGLVWDGSACSVPNTAPILSVSDQSHTIGLSNTIVGSCTDDEDGSLALSPGTYQPDSPGPHSVTVSCTDSEGASDSRVISITGVCSAGLVWDGSACSVPNTAPILSVSDQSHTIGLSNTIVGSCTDDEDGSLALSPGTYQPDSPGPHSVTVSCTDSEGASDSRVISITGVCSAGLVWDGSACSIPNTAPILSVSDQSHTIGLSNTIVGSCTDNEDGSLALSPGTYQPDSPGPHSVTVSCTDSEGASDSRVISITGVCSAGLVWDGSACSVPNTAPILSVSDQSHTIGLSNTIVGSCTDNEDGSLALSPGTYQPDSPGPHSVTVSCTDSEGASDSRVISITGVCSAGLVWDGSTCSVPNTAPILSVSDQSHTIGLSNTIVGSCTDNEDGSLALSPGTYQPDSPGPHSVTVSCTDSEGASDSRVISITGVCSAGLVWDGSACSVPNTAPILSVSDQSHTIGLSNTIVGSCTDNEDGSLALSPGTYQPDSPGPHSVTVSCTDSEGASDSRVISITGVCSAGLVWDGSACSVPNTAPILSVSDQSHTIGLSNTIVGSCTDDEDGSLALSPGTYQPDSPGPHSVTVSCTDSEGASDSRVISITGVCSAGLVWDGSSCAEPSLVSIEGEIDDMNNFQFFRVEGQKVIADDNTVYIDSSDHYINEGAISKVEGYLDDDGDFVAKNVTISSLAPVSFKKFPSGSSFTSIEKVSMYEYTSYDSCNYTGTVALQVKFNLRESGGKNLVVMGKSEDLGWLDYASKDLASESGYGSKVFVFDTTDCLTNIRAKFE